MALKILMKRNYESIKKRGLITEKTGFRDFSNKIFEECTEFDYEIMANGTKHFKDDIIDSDLPPFSDPIDFTKINEELADIILVCLNFASHYGINIERELKNKIEKNFKRKD